MYLGQLVWTSSLAFLGHDGGNRISKMDGDIRIDIFGKGYNICIFAFDNFLQMARKWEERNMFSKKL